MEPMLVVGALFAVAALLVLGVASRRQRRGGNGDGHDGGTVAGGSGDGHCDSGSDGGGCDGGGGGD